MTVSSGAGKSVINHGLAFLGLLAFIVSFGGARMFTTLHPHTWVIIDGIHVHHFWYGLTMMAVAGWLGIISTVPTHRRLYALVFGLGAGLIADEAGLLLTFGNYYSQLTFVFAIGFIVVALMGLLLSSYRNRLKDDVLGIGTNERIMHLGVVVAGLSVAAFSVSEFLVGSVILAIGITVAVIGAAEILKLEKMPPGPN